MQKIIAFDLETQYIADEVGGWNNIRDMRLAVGVTYNASEGTYRDYTEQEAELLIADLRGADLVVGYNVLRFDYEVLRAYTDDPLSDIPTVDMLQHIYRALGLMNKAKNSFEKVLKLQPSNKKAQEHIMSLKSEKKKPFSKIFSKQKKK